MSPEHNTTHRVGVVFTRCSSARHCIISHSLISDIYRTNPNDIGCVSPEHDTICDSRKMFKYRNWQNAVREEEKKEEEEIILIISFSLL